MRRVVRDLDIPVRIEVCPTVREPDGLAMSSRNAYLAPAERERAVALRRALDAAEQAVAAGERDATAVAATARDAMTPYGVEPEYLALVAPRHARAGRSDRRRDPRRRRRARGPRPPHRQHPHHDHRQRETLNRCIARC